jgi:hypothetical protein
LNCSLATVIRYEEAGLLDKIKQPGKRGAMVYHRSEQVHALAEGRVASPTSPPAFDAAMMPSAEPATPEPTERPEAKPKRSDRPRATRREPEPDQEHRRDRPRSKRREVGNA